MDRTNVLARFRRRLVPMLLLALVPLAAAPVPSVLAAGDDVVQVSAGHGHTCARKSDSTVWCWGADFWGQLGDGTRGDTEGVRRTPVQVIDGADYLSSVKSISAGGNHTCALKTDGSVWCWGLAQSGQLGDGTSGDADGVRLAPVRVKRGDGYLTSVKSLSSGGVHTCAVRTDGSAWCWGGNQWAELGDGTTAGHRPKPVRVRQGSGYLGDVRSISAGLVPENRGHSCATKTNGTVWCWGDAANGAVGDGTTGDSNHFRRKAVQVRKGSGYLTGVRSTSAGAQHSCALRTDESVWCWGQADYGSVGDGTYGDSNGRRLKAVRVRRGSGYLTRVTSLDAGGWHSCVVRTDATAWCWGAAGAGQVGDGTLGDSWHQARRKAVQVKLGTGYLTSVRGVTAGSSHSCAVRTDATAWCWGANEFAGLGDGTTAKATSPVRVVFPAP